MSDLLNTKEQLQGARPENSISSSPPVEPLSDPWLHDFYKECGREVTLAYTTLNQMKNWAIVVQGTIIAAVAAFGRSAFATSGAAAKQDISIAVVIGAVLAHLFTLRFMVRGILCYINLLRWNKLQHAVIQFQFMRSHQIPLDRALNESALEKQIREYYFDWASPVGRGAQVSSMLKLGFGLLLALPAALVTWGALTQWDVSLVRGLAVFAVGGTVIEFLNFLSSRFFDTPERSHRRKRKRSIFPAPSGTAGYIVLWVVNIIISSWIVIGIDKLRLLLSHSPVSAVVVVCTLYLTGYILAAGFLARAGKFRAYLGRVAAGFTALVALSVLVSSSWTPVIIAASAGAVLGGAGLAARRRANADVQEEPAAILPRPGSEANPQKTQQSDAAPK